jgi:hypothetical protein
MKAMFLHMQWKTPWALIRTYIQLRKEMDSLPGYRTLNKRERSMVVPYMIYLTLFMVGGYLMGHYLFGLTGYLIGNCFGLAGSYQ